MHSYGIAGADTTCKVRITTLQSTSFYLTPLVTPAKYVLLLYSIQYAYFKPWHERCLKYVCVSVVSEIIRFVFSFLV